MAQDNADDSAGKNISYELKFADRAQYKIPPRMRAYSKQFNEEWMQRKHKTAAKRCARLEETKVTTLREHSAKSTHIANSQAAKAKERQLMTEQLLAINMYEHLQNRNNFLQDRVEKCRLHNENVEQKSKLLKYQECSEQAACKKKLKKLKNNEIEASINESKSHSAASNYQNRNNFLHDRVEKCRLHNKNVEQKYQKYSEKVPCKEKLKKMKNSEIESESCSAAPKSMHPKCATRNPIKRSKK